MNKLSVLGLIKNTKLSILTLFSLGLPIFIMVVWGLVADIVFHRNAPQALNYGILFLCIFLAGTTGLFQAIKKEAPGIMGRPIKGIWAVISGVLIMILCWGINLLIVYYLVVEIFG